MSHEEAYQLYLQRFEERVGKVEVGGFGSFNGNVIKKLTAEEFATKWQDFVDIRSSYEAMIGRQLTIDSVLERLLKERAAELIVELPKTLLL